MTATHARTRRTSAYIGLFTLDPSRGTADAQLDDLIASAASLGYAVSAAYRRDGAAGVTLRLPNDHAASDAFRSIATDTYTPLAGVITGVGIHRREVPA